MTPPGQTVMAVAVTPLGEAVVAVTTILRVTVAPLGEAVLAVTSLTRVSVSWVSGEKARRAAAPHERLTSVELD